MLEQKCNENDQQAVYSGCNVHWFTLSARKTESAHNILLNLFNAVHAVDLLDQPRVYLLFASLWCRYHQLLEIASLLLKHFSSMKHVMTV